MTPPQITALEMEAAIAAEQANAAKSRASIATLEHQRSLLGVHTPAPAGSSGASWVIVLFLAIAAFVAGANTFDESHRLQTLMSAVGH
jgi:hypothetical protein